MSHFDAPYYVTIKTEIMQPKGIPTLQRIADRLTQTSVSERMSFTPQSKGENLTLVRLCARGV
eukprot:5412410-Amphidinium_carterae.1